MDLLPLQTHRRFPSHQKEIQATEGGGLSSNDVELRSSLNARIAEDVGWCEERE